MEYTHQVARNGYWPFLSLALFNGFKGTPKHKPTLLGGPTPKKTFPVGVSYHFPSGADPFPI